MSKKVEEKKEVTLYKFLSPDMTSYNNTLWKLGERKEVSGDMSQPLCTSAWLHGYEDPLIAEFMYPKHLSYNQKYQLYKGIGIKGKEARDFKVGYSCITLTEEVSREVISLPQRIVIAILINKTYYKEKSWLLWADNWLSGKDRSKKSAYAAAYAAAADAAYAAADAAYAAADAADAAYAAADADAAYADAAYAAAYAAADAAYAAAYAAADAADAAYAAAADAAADAAAADADAAYAAADAADADAADADAAYAADKETLLATIIFVISSYTSEGYKKVMMSL